MTLLHGLLEKRQIAFDYYSSIPSSALVFSFSLFGNDDYYFKCGLRLFKQIVDSFPDSHIIVHSSSSSFDTYDLSSYISPNIHFINMGNELIPFEGVYWRSFVAEFGFSAYFVRDIDSFWGLRDTNIVKHWLSSSSLFHIIRDGEGQKSEIMCGLWGGKSIKLVFIRQMFLWMIRLNKQNISIEYDQHFFSRLHAIICPQASVYTSSNVYISDRNVFSLSLPDINSNEIGNSHFCGQQPNDLLYTSTNNIYDRYRSEPKQQQRIFNNTSLSRITYLPLNIRVSPYPSLNILTTFIQFSFALLGVSQVKRISLRLFLSYIFRYLLNYKTLLSFKLVRIVS